MNEENETRADYRRRVNNQPESGTNGAGTGGNGRNPHPPYYRGGKKWFKWVKRIIFLILLLIVAGGAYEYHQINSTAKDVFSSGNGKISAKLKAGKPISILAMGTDVGALNRGNTGGNTDTLELITINPKKKTITMTSIPRDTLIKVNTDEGADYVKINATYQIGGAKQTVKQVKELLGVPIDYYAVINMGVLEKVVNAVGGVTVDNPFAFTYEGHHFKKGKQHLNGANALKYSRMRYDDPNGDYGRQKRQQQVMESVIKTFKKSGSITAANDILKAVGDGVKTDIPIDNVAALYTNYHAAMDNVKTYHMQDLDATIEGVSFQIATPKEINRISKLIRTQLGLKTKTVTNAETRMYNEQTTYDGYTNVNFVLPNGASYNSPGSGTSSSSTSSSYGTSSYGTSSYGTSSYGTGTTGSAFGY